MDELPTEETPKYARFARKRVAARQSASPRQRGGPRWGVWVAAAAMLAAVGYAAINTAARADPHFTRAREIVDRYERGRPEASRNYNGPAYDQALEELAQVAPRSVSADPARKMARDIEDRRHALGERKQAQAARLAVAQEKRKQRQGIEFARREDQLANPVTEFPECDE